MRNILFVISLALVSCGPSKEEIEAREKIKKDSTESAQSLLMLENTATVTSPGPEHLVTTSSKQYCDNANFNIGIYSVNGCEYISFGQGKGCCAVVHAGNCINPIHYQAAVDIPSSRMTRGPIKV